MAVSSASIRFLGDWHQGQQGTIERGGRLSIDYDMRRSPHCFTNWRGAEFGEIVASVRFHPRGEIINGSVIAPVTSPSGLVIGHVPVPFELPVPDDAARAEIWFHNFYQTSSRCDAWDSQFGQNYWFEVGGASPRIPAESVSYRIGAVSRPDMVNVLEQSVTKINAFPRPAGGGSPQGIDLQTMLSITAWVRETTYGANAWIDFHVFDGEDRLVHAQTLTLPYTGFGSAFQYGFSGKIYQGSTAVPGSA